MRIRLLLAVVAIAALTAAIPAKDAALRLTVDGLERTATLYVPDRPADKMPLLIVLHGHGGRGRGMRALSRSGFDRLANRDGFVVAYPDGIDRSWNDGRIVNSGPDDVAFVRALIDRIATDHRIDPQRVYVTGMSNGGFMSLRLAWDLPDRIAAAAAVTAAMPKDVHPTDGPPTSVLIMNGTADPLVPYGGGQVARNRGAILSTKDSIDYWVARDRCNPTPTITSLPDRSPSDGTSVRTERYVGGTKGTEVLLVTIENGGHTWPGGWQYLPVRAIGKTSQDIDACDMIWDFLKRQRR